MIVNPTGAERLVPSPLLPGAMHLLDWAVVVAYLVWIVWDGLRRSKATIEVEAYFLANR